MTKTGPNDARHVVWAKGRCFFFASRFFYTNQQFLFYLGYIHVFKWQGGFSWMAMRKTGPNDARCRHLGPRCVFFSSHFFNYLSTFFRAFFVLNTPCPLQSHLHTPPSLETQVRGVFPPFLCPPLPYPLPHSKRETEGLFQLPPHAEMTKPSPNDKCPSFGP